MAANSKGTARGPGRPFEKGQSGNPSGRPKMDDETKTILKAAAPDAARLMVKMMNDPKIQPKLRMQAAEVVMDRVYGKATQPIEGSMDNKVEIILKGDLDKYGE